MVRLSLSDLRFVRSASAPLSNELYHALKQKFDIPVIEAFGMTEALSHCFTNPLHGPQRVGTIGLPDGVEAKIVHNKLFLKGPTVFQSDWYDTGDLATQDDHGYYKITGRSKDQINVRGTKLNPVSMEQHLRTAVPEISDCVIFGTDQVKCLYVGSCSPDNVNDVLLGLGRHCRATLIQQVNDIPVSPSGKISRTWLNSQY